MVESDFDVTGLEKAVGRAMDELDQQLDTAVNLGADAVAADMRGTDTFNDVTGALRNSMQNAGSQGRFSTDDLSADVAYAATSDEGYPYGIALNDGSKPHVIRARRRKRLRIPMPDGFAWPVEVNHPGTEARHFADDALDGRLGFIVQTLERASERAMRKAGF